MPPWSASFRSSPTTTTTNPLVLRSSAVLIRREERFAKTAVGWILRDLSKRHATLVNGFFEENLAYFSTESLRNALKYSPETTRRRLINRMKAAQQPRAGARARHR